MCVAAALFSLLLMVEILPYQKVKLTFPAALCIDFFNGYVHMVNNH